MNYKSIISHSITSLIIATLVLSFSAGTAYSKPPWMRNLGNSEPIEPVAENIVIHEGNIGEFDLIAGQHEDAGNLNV